MKFNRLENLIGSFSLEKLKNSTVLVVGLGGVGGYVVEALARSGIGNLILVDYDKVDITNFNRQIIAINENIGVFPANIQSDIKLNFEVLKNYGMIIDYSLFIDGSFSLYLSHAAIHYFDNKKRAEEVKQKAYIQIENLNANGSNVVLGDLFNSSLSIDNSIQSIENEIREKGGDDKEELLALFEEVKDYAENIQNCRSVTKNRSLLNKLKEHVSKNSWFYAEVVAFLGDVVLKTMG